jgi:uncharacterized protein (TIGR01777 family)
MAILVTGATGLVGKELVLTLLAKKHHVHILSRDSKKAMGIFPTSNQLKFFDWNYHSNIFPKEALVGVDRIVHLMGENIAEARWSNKQKAEILNSRVESLKSIFETLKQHPEIKISKLISTSAIGIYGTDKIKKFDETSETEKLGFLAFVCQEWEKIALKFKELPTNVAILRVGIVLSNHGGALKKMLLPFKLGIGGTIGSGNQYMSWIHVRDLVNLYVKAIEDTKFDGIINAVSPQVVTNREFTKSLATALNRPSFLPVPSLALKAVLGEMSELLLEGQWVNPQKAIDHKYKFEFENIDAAFNQLVK